MFQGTDQCITYISHCYAKTENCILRKERFIFGSHFEVQFITTRIAGQLESVARLRRLVMLCAQAGSREQ